MARPDIPVVPLREAAQILGVSVEAAKSSLRHHSIRSGYPLAAVKWLATNRPGQGARTDLKETTVNTTTGPRILHSTTRDAIYTGGDPALQLIQAAIDAGDTIRASYSADRDYEIRLVEYTPPDTDEIRWAYVATDPAEAETRDFPGRAEAEAYYERDVRSMVGAGWVFDTCDVEPA